MDQLLVPATADPITRALLKSWLRKGTAEEDGDVDELCRAVVSHVEGFLGRTLVKQTRKLILDRFPGEIRLPRSPLRSVSHIKYLDEAGAQQTLATTEYRVDKASDEPRITPDWGKTWPNVRDVVNAVEITYIAGYLLPATVDAGSDVITCAGHGLSAGEVVHAYALGVAGAIPAGGAARTNYFVINPATDTLQVSGTSGGAAVNFTDAGTAPWGIGYIDPDILAGMKLIAGHLWEHREENADFQVFEMPLGATRLLLPHAVRRF